MLHPFDVLVYWLKTQLSRHDSHLTGGNIFHGAMGLDSLFLMRPAKGWYVCNSDVHISFLLILLLPCQSLKVESQKSWI